MFGKMSAAEIDQLLQQQLVGRIGCHANRLTYVVPVSYAYDGSYIYCHTYEGMKMNMMRKNPAVCFEVDNTKNLSNWQSVIAWGVFEELTGGVERKDAIKALRDRKLPILSSETMHLGSNWPFASAEDQIDGIIFRIQLKEKTGRYEKW
jgi:nitroimidazol reductase NimA-like FMN-containing flavoprotein (pyridoxamine 5'-phosphate oxidase superfamily)